MFVKIADAPFTDAEKNEIINLGVTMADWGHPTVVLPDPVQYFKDKQASRKLKEPTKDDKKPRWLDEEPNQFGV